MKLIGTIDSDSNTISSTATKTAFDKTINMAGVSLQAGDTLEVFASGRYTATATVTLDLFIDINGVTAGDPGVSIGSTGTNQHWNLQGFLTVRSVGASGAVLAFTHLEHGADAIRKDFAGGNGTITIDTTVDLLFTIYAQYGTAGSNAITMEQYFQNSDVLFTGRTRCGSCVSVRPVRIILTAGGENGKSAYVRPIGEWVRITRRLAWRVVQ